MTRIVATVLALALTTSAWALPYSISILPRQEPAEALRQITPLAEYLKEATGLEVVPMVTASFSEYESKVNRGEIAIGYENPYIYARTSANHQAIAVASRGASGPRFRGVIITRADSTIATIDELRGKKVGIIGYTSACGYLSQKLTLMAAGINPDTELHLSEAMYNKADNVMMSVYYGDLDAGFIQDGDWAKEYEYIPKSQLKVIGRGEWLPNWAMSVSRSMPEADRVKIQEALMALPEGHAALEALQAHGFHEISDADFNSVRKAAGMPLAE
ncbi:MAG: phosphate/phosphite/phosphonate ABC transporter substrate-binding protein [Deltaproteobacteria bacterium]|nr:phosphate/phosphite/phosphonate ABC transporter substrate-binding protein [Deltaproteobacteria bacterium]